MTPCIPLACALALAGRIGAQQVMITRLPQPQTLTGNGLIEGTVINEIQAKLANDSRFPPGTIEFGGLYQQQQESFHNLMIVMIMAVLLIFTVLVDASSQISPSRFAIVGSCGRARM